MSKRTILIVDDELDVLTMLNKGLSCSGFDVIEATNGKLGIELACRHHPDVILLDIAMPGLSGTEVLGILKSNESTQDIPIIMLTALSDRDYVIEALIGEAYAYIEKPYTHGELITMVEKALSSPKMAEAPESRLI